MTYVLNSIPLYFDQAYNWCYAQGGALPIPMSSEENEILASIAETWPRFDRLLICQKHRNHKFIVKHKIKF